MDRKLNKKTVKALNGISYTVKCVINSGYNLSGKVGTLHSYIVPSFGAVDKRDKQRKTSSSEVARD